MPTAEGTWTRDGEWINPLDTRVSKIMAKRGPRGNYPCILIQPIFRNFLFVYEPSHLWLSVPKANHWMHARGWVWLVTSQSYWEHGGWVQSGWGRVWVNKGKTKRGILYGWGNNSFSYSSLVHGKKGEIKKRGWSWCSQGEWILEKYGAYLSVLQAWIEEPNCQAWRANSCMSFTKTTHACCW